MRTLFECFVICQLFKTDEFRITLQMPDTAFYWKCWGESKWDILMLYPMPFLSHGGIYAYMKHKYKMLSYFGSSLLTFIKVGSENNHLAFYLTFCFAKQIGP